MPHKVRKITCIISLTELLTQTERPAVHIEYLETIVVRGNRLEVRLTITNVPHYGSYFYAVVFTVYVKLMVSQALFRWSRNRQNVML